ncbi:GTPase IMAP family member 1-like [Sinocyclocheilus rhinocerous]|uniref:GTPase IMAP family member 1-like n=1 Tax=Sinocyclocheilus rhinocerous TaxID=307959 RepID=UPI0007BAA0E1|nr:PREDICTED: GTPase IMAP family member 1-like [Sinocyclocheilus rhinocerous]
MNHAYSNVIMRPWPRYVPKVPTTPFRDQVVNQQTLSSKEADPIPALLCPVCTLCLYVDRTQSFRASGQLFVCNGGQQKGKAVSQQRLNHWIVDAIVLAYQALDHARGEGSFYEERSFLLGIGTWHGGRLTRWIPDIRPNIVSSLSSRRIVLLGQAGVGKSASGNTILGQKVFRSEMAMNVVTHECSEEHTTVSDRSVSVVDTPPFFDTHMKPEELVMGITRRSSPGPHAFLIILRANDRFTEQDQQIPQMIEMMFGQEVLKYSIILFTHGDRLEEPIEELTEENSRLRHLVDRCGGRFHVFNNRDQNKSDQVNVLLQKIDTMIEQNGGGHYSNQMF